MGDINLAIYLDDLSLTGPEDDIKNVMDIIEIEFCYCKRKTGPEFKFIRIEFKIENDGVGVKIDLNNLLENVNGNVDTPCGIIKLLSITSDVEELNPQNREVFHSVVVKLLYVAKRTRPEVLFSVKFLCTRVG